MKADLITIKATKRTAMLLRIIAALTSKKQYDVLEQAVEKEAQRQKIKH